jgi:hypothetical protein
MKHAYLTKEFARLARRGGLTDDGLAEAIDRAEDGKIDADLGGGFIKQRVARPGKGRSGGFRTIIAYRKGARAIFLHLFAKARQANLSKAPSWRSCRRSQGRSMRSMMSNWMNSSPAADGEGLKEGNG